MTAADKAPIAPLPGGGLLIINADDWGRDRPTTDSILECWLGGAISSVSAMVFMEDSERAAAVARERGVEAGLHLNFTEAFSGASLPPGLREHQQRVARHLLRHRFAQVVFHPGLVSSFKYVVASQLDEFGRLYGRAPARVDGHHHMHLCSNVLGQRLLPRETIVRRSFSFEPGEKSRANYIYRRAVDRVIARRHVLTDYFFSLPPMQVAGRLPKIFSLARDFAVEVETHPINADERRFLADGGLRSEIGDMPVATPSQLHAAVKRTTWPAREK